MKLNLAYSEDEVETIEIEKTIQFGFDENAQQMIFKMFSKNIYSNPIGSIIREITSNCFDSHVEANVTDPVILKLTKENADFYISFIDVGVGMSPERVVNSYASAFSSTKRNDNNQIGGFGVGSMSLLAYAEAYFLTTVFDGKKYIYNIRKGQTRPEADLLSINDTDERNGTIIKLPVKGSDVQTFEREINRQLYYFENVIFEGFSQMVKNDYKIIEGKNFLYRGNDYNSYAHICLGRVAYPIDFNVFDSNDLDQNDWSVPVALKIDIGEINVTVSREAIDYTAETKKLIKKKLKAVKEELVAMLEKQHEKLNSLEEYYQVENSYADLLLTNGYVINIKSMLRNLKYDKPTLKKLNAINIPTQTELVHMFYDVSMYGKKKRKEYTWDKSVKTINENNVFLVGNEEKIPRKKNAYMKSLYKHFYTINRKEFRPSQLKLIIKKIISDGSTASLKVIFKQFRELQKEAQNIIESRVKLYSNVTIPDGFSLKSTKYNPNFELVIGFVSDYGIKRVRHKITDLKDCNATFYYGTAADETLLNEYKKLYEILFDHSDSNKYSIIKNEYNSVPVRFVLIAKTNIKFVEEFKNFKPVAEAGLMFQRKREKVLLHIEKTKFMDAYGDINSLFLNENLFGNIDSKYAKVIAELKKIWKKYHTMPKMSLYCGDGSFAKKVFALKENQVTFKGENLIKLVKEKEAKNSMMKFVSVSNDFDPKNSGYNAEDTANVMQLLDLIYVK